MTVRLPNAPQYRRINIIANGNTGEIMVIDHFTLLNKYYNEEAEWVILPDKREFTIKFDKGDGTPFKQEEFSGDGTIVSGPIEVSAEDPPKTYRYSVVVPGIGSMDPGVIIWDRR